MRFLGRNQHGWGWGKWRDKPRMLNLNAGIYGFFLCGCSYRLNVFSVDSPYPESADRWTWPPSWIRLHRIIFQSTIMDREAGLGESMGWKGDRVPVVGFSSGSVELCFKQKFCSCLELAVERKTTQGLTTHLLSWPPTALQVQSVKKPWHELNNTLISLWDSDDSRKTTKSEGENPVTF